MANQLALNCNKETVKIKKQKKCVGSICIPYAESCSQRKREGKRERKPPLFFCSEESNKSYRGKYHMIALITVILKNKRINSQEQRVYWWLPEARDGVGKIVEGGLRNKLQL